MSLRLSLIASIGLVMVATLILGSALTYWHALNKVETEMQAAIAVGGRIALNAIDDVDESVNARRRLELMVADFNGDRHLKAQVIDGENKVSLESALAQPEDPVPDWFYWLLKGESQSVNVKLPPAFDKLGQFVLRTDSHNEVSEVWDDVTNTLTVLFAFCAMTLGLVSWTLGRALKPLEKLSRAFTVIASPDFAPRIPETGPFELKRVYHGFNEMAERLAATEAQNRRLEQQLTTVQEEERAEIARDLHDEIGPFLFAADVDAATVARLIDSGSREELHGPVRQIRESVGHMQRHVKEMLARLRAVPLVELGLAVALENLVSFWRNRHGEIAFTTEVPAESFGEPVDGTVYRIVQECLSNAVRHGQPRHIDIRIGRGPEAVEVVVTDDGTGLKPNGNSRAGYGIRGMGERVKRLSGKLEIANRSDGPGVRVAARLPLTAASEVDSPQPTEAAQP